MSFFYEFSFEFPEEAPGTGTAVFPRDAVPPQFARGVKFGNAPGGRSDVGDLRHANSVETIEPIANTIVAGASAFSGAVKFRNRSYRSFFVPRSVRGG